MLELSDGSFGLALNLEAETVGAVRFASSFGEQTCTEGSLVRTTSQVANIQVGDSFRGRMVNALGAPVDGKGDVTSEVRRAIHRPAPSYVDLDTTRAIFETGITGVDRWRTECKYRDTEMVECKISNAWLRPFAASERASTVVASK